MGLDEEDFRMLAVSVPTVDLWDLRGDLDRLGDAVSRLERTLEALFELYRSERIRNWELILEQIMEQRGHRNDNRTHGTKSKTADHE